MRSTSRYGPHDFGDNAARIAFFLADLDVQVAYLTVVAPVEPAGSRQSRPSLHHPQLTLRPPKNRPSR